MGELTVKRTASNEAEHSFGAHAGDLDFCMRLMVLKLLPEALLLAV